MTNTTLTALTGVRVGHATHLDKLTGCTAIMECLRADGRGSRSGPDGSIVNPSVTGAAIYDLGMDIAPYDAEYGAEAYRNATTAPVQGGNVGAGTGAAVGTFLWLAGGAKVGAMKGGIGSARVDVGGGIIVTALSVVNAMGNVVLPDGSLSTCDTQAEFEFTVTLIIDGLQVRRVALASNS